MWDGLSKPVKDVVLWGLLLAFCVISEQLLFNSLLYGFGVLKKSLVKVVSKPSSHCVITLLVDLCFVWWAFEILRPGLTCLACLVVCSMLFWCKNVVFWLLYSKLKSQFWHTIFGSMSVCGLCVLTMIKLSSVSLWGLDGDQVECSDWFF